MNDTKNLWLQRRRRLCEILEAGSAADPVSRIYDVFSTLMTLINVAVKVMYTQERISHATTIQL